MHRTAATPLACIYVLLIVYASLYPFADWRNQGVTPGAFLLAPLPRYWTAFDVWINLIGYVPLGALFALSSLRTGGGRPALFQAALLASLVSLSMETLQSFLPARVASREDWLLNTAGAWIGLAVTVVLERWGVIDRWSAFRTRWFVPQARGGLVLLATWPVALLFPPAIPFGLGQVGERLREWLALFPAFDGWFSAQPVIALQPLPPMVESFCVALGLLIPCLIAGCVVRPGGRRLIFTLFLVLVGVLATALSALLSWGPNHIWSWFDSPTQLALLGLLLVVPWLSRLPVSVLVLMSVLSLGLLLGVLNRAPSSPYFALTLQDWEQGRFIRFHGLAQWLGWAWPYAALIYVVLLRWSGATKTRIVT